MTTPHPQKPESKCQCVNCHPDASPDSTIWSCEHCDTRDNTEPEKPRSAESTAVQSPPIAESELEARQCFECEDIRWVNVGYFCTKCGQEYVPIPTPKNESKKCPVCEGSGDVHFKSGFAYKKCPNCDGRGIVNE